MRRFYQVLSADLLAKAVLGVVSIALIRYLSTEAFALYTLSVALATAVAQLVASGANRVFIVGHERLALSSRTTPFLVVQLAAVIAFAILGIPLASRLHGLYLLVVALALAMVLAEFSKTFYQQQMRFARFSTIEVGRAILQGAVVGLLIAAFGDSLGAGAVLAAQALSLLAVFAAALGGQLDWRGGGNLQAVRHTAREVISGHYAPLIAYFGVIAVFSQADIFMLKLVGDAQDLAAYGAAFRYYALLSLALGAVHAVLLPAIQRASTAAELHALYAQHFRLLGVFVPAVLLVAWLSGWVLPWIDRGRYPESVSAFRILAVSSVISFAFSPHVNFLMKLERFRFLLGLIVVALAVAIGLHAVLIPRFGAPGAASATLIASALVTITIFWVARRRRLELAQPGSRR